MTKCHWGAELPKNGGPCKVCGADENGVCGKAWEAGYRAGYEKAIAMFANPEEGDEDLRYLAIWLNENRPDEAKGPDHDVKRC